jgi:hypothetical protein
MTADTIPAENVDALVELLLDVDERLAREDAAAALAEAEPA